jgi:hypothetical protein
MAQNVNIGITNWRATGSNVSVAQYKVDVSLAWIDDTGTAQTYSGTLTFPNDFSLVPLVWLKDEIQDLIIRAARKRLGIDA